MLQSRPEDVALLQAYFPSICIALVPSPSPSITQAWQPHPSNWVVKAGESGGQGSVIHVAFHSRGVGLSACPLSWKGSCPIYNWEYNLAWLAGSWSLFSVGNKYKTTLKEILNDLPAFFKMLLFFLFLAHLHFVTPAFFSDFCTLRDSWELKSLSLINLLELNLLPLPN